jgi:hypothetical protein
MFCFVLLRLCVYIDLYHIILAGSKHIGGEYAHIHALLTPCVRSSRKLQLLLELPRSAKNQLCFGESKLVMRDAIFFIFQQKKIVHHVP